MRWPHVDKDVFFKMRIKITGVAVVLVTLVLVIVFMGIAMGEYNSKLDFVSTQLDNALTELTKKTPSSHTQLYSEPSGNMIPPQQSSNYINEPYYNAIDSSKKNENNSGAVNLFNNTILAPNIGLNSEYMKAYVPIIVYRIDPETRTLIAVDEQMAHLTAESLVEANATLIDAPYGYAKDEASNLYYLKKSTSAGDMIAFTDISTINYYLQSMGQAFLLVAVVVMLALGIVAWVTSGWIVQPARDAWKRQKRFIADASHELKTPISVIVANSALVLEAQDTTEESKKWTKATLSEAESMKALVEDMLYLAANDSEKGTTFEDVNLSKEVMRSAMQFEARAFEKNNVIDYSDVDSGIIIEGELAGIRRLLGILLDNACKYSYENTIIQVVLERGIRHVSLLVYDIGEKIPENLEKDVFERFVRADEARSGANGYGLGLSMARDIVERHGGDISAATTKDGRTVFKVSLPLKVKGRK